MRHPYRGTTRTADGRYRPALTKPVDERNQAADGRSPAARRRPRETGNGPGATKQRIPVRRVESHLSSDERNPWWPPRPHPPTTPRPAVSGPPGSRTTCSLHWNGKWAQLTTAPATQTALRRWGRLEPTLAGYADVEQIRADAHRRGATAQSDDLLAALARLAACDCGDDPLAARALLQLLLPAAALAYRLAHLPRAEAIAAVLSTLSCRIRTYPWRRRPHRVAANLLLDTEMDLRRARARERARVELSLTALADRTDHRQSTADRLDLVLAWASRLAEQPLYPRRPADPAEVEEDPREQLLTLFCWAVDTDVISPDDVALLTAIDLHQHPVAALADEHGIAPRSLARRRQRALARLRAARRDYLQATAV